MKQEEFIKELLTTYELKRDYPQLRYDLLNYLSKQVIQSEVSGYTLDQMEQAFNLGYESPSMPVSQVRPIFKKFIESLTPPDAEKDKEIDKWQSEFDILNKAYQEVTKERDELREGIIAHRDAYYNENGSLSGDKWAYLTNLLTPTKE